LKSSTGNRLRFESRLDKVFNIISCRCLIEVCPEEDAVTGETSEYPLINCKCDTSKKIPGDKLLFLRNQRLRGVEVNDKDGRLWIQKRKRKFS